MFVLQLNHEQSISTIEETETQETDLRNKNQLQQMY